MAQRVGCYSQGYASSLRVAYSLNLDRPSAAETSGISYVLQLGLVSTLRNTERDQLDVEFISRFWGFW